LQRHGYHVTGIDTAQVLVAKANERYPDVHFVVGEVDQLPVGEGAFDCISFFDVLEHLSDPRSLLMNALSHVRPGGAVIATVPGIQSLFSEIDQASGHKRRFEPQELAELLGSVGVLDVTEWGIFRCLVPLMRRRKMRPHASF
jgi:2-polyprenyl-3-methyl-5-hydroxy-6-metoxy-1,4-benzoquinol methylase